MGGIERLRPFRVVGLADLIPTAIAEDEALGAAGVAGHLRMARMALLVAARRAVEVDSGAWPAAV